ncbi:hypothetical protein QCD85_04270 [Paenibacillus sp. PsM32]|uniref:Uncharacterized protein n=1 Tax=Paenibacillus kyungheensis TaxID=1452732 RepID=A0AAX3M3P1_9BACL|nr:MULTISPECIES: hypothetical protein [Paenibacillus]MDN4617296.1 hypothetical protein [Paenibacillus sp. PsM32]MDQ1232857.1 hypothetical protein [Paenibacillus sp. SORGH_AS_0306]MDR6109905.1 hypothetical protein [Paenibacillus sp. SORGH_AS_0338]WCT56885.1 hypothetical protein PQ456_05005 [Paenibacillus kyungheensis]WDF50023.1 hypothetical protein PQ460_18830 [Paenibacillus sp. KACC 21273]
MILRNDMNIQNPYQPDQHIDLGLQDERNINCCLKTSYTCFMFFNLLRTT